MYRLEGAYSLVLMSATKLLAARDPQGFRPLCYGRRDDGTYVVASESCALSAVGAHFERDLLPGEILVFDKSGVRSILKNTVVEFRLKSDELGDPMINDCQITALGVATQAELDELCAMSLRIDERMTALFAKAGIKRIDFKLEFGRVDGELVLCDEISPDSCRLWDAATDEKLDKGRFRRDLGNVLDGYRAVLTRIKG